MNIKAIITSKKFWTLVTAIVAALAAYFMSACTYSAKIHRSGVHIDTVRVDQTLQSSKLYVQEIPQLRTYFAKIHRSGAHIDTVRVDQTLWSRNTAASQFFIV